ncbi:MAG: hypothetical protein ACLROI_07050 [Beduini sp.]|mgnify:CR=1 FL=1|uniref:hypothetical protein n=1 Tax=Beduini sp. TaxID=1922300 RepID=UPI0039906BAA
MSNHIIIDGVQVDKELALSIAKKILIKESINVKTKEFSGPEMVKIIAKMIEGKDNVIK